MSTIDMSKNEALDKKAENARELGLDYEPAQQEPVAWMQNTTAGLYVIDHYDEWHCIPLYTSPPTLSLAQQDIQRLSALVRAQQITIDKLEAQQEQEPVYLVWMEAHSAWLHTDKDGFDRLDPENRWLLYTSPLAPQEPVATDWERIARVQDAKLRAMCNESGGFEKLCEVMDRYEHTSPPAQQEPVAKDNSNYRLDAPGLDTLYASPPAQRKPLTDEQIEDIWADCPADWDDKINVLTLARAIEAAHGIKGEA